MAGEVVFPGRGGSVTVSVAGALDGAGTVASPLAVKVDGTTIEIDGSNELHVLGGNPFDQDLNTDDDVTFASASVGTGPFASTGNVRLPFEGTISSRNNTDAGDVTLIRSTVADFSGQLVVEIGNDDFRTPVNLPFQVVIGYAVDQTSVLGFLKTDGSDFVGIIEKEADNTFNVGNFDFPLEIKSSTLRVRSDADVSLEPTNDLTINGTPGVTAGPFTAITSITVTKGIITAITGT